MARAGRLVREALYSNELVNEHMFRDLRRDRHSAGPTPIGNFEAGWENLAARIREIDPYRQRSAALLCYVLSHP